MERSISAKVWLDIGEGICGVGLAWLVLQLNDFSLKLDHLEH
jgi:hypothetical protein